jgi:hypothetical protein
MRYYKQFHGWPYVHWIVFLFGCVCLGLVFAYDDLEVRVGFSVCAVFVMYVAWVLWKGRRHYLEINPDWIVHHGLKQWRLKKTDVIHVEHGRKGWVEEYDLYLKVHAGGREYNVDDGFLIHEQRVEDLARAMQTK